MNAPTPHGIMQQTLQATASDHGLTPDILVGTSRKRSAVRARQDAMYRLRAIKRPNGKPRYSLPQIGRFLGRRHHAPIIHGLRAWESHVAKFTSAGENAA